MINRIIKSASIAILGFFLITSPISVIAQNNTPPAGSNSTVAPSEQAAPSNVLVYICTRGAPGECTFDDLIAAVDKLVDWGTLFALGFSIVVIAWAGFKIMISGDNQGERTKAKEMLGKVAIGIALILTAWLIVSLIINALGVDTGSIKFT